MSLGALALLYALALLPYEHYDRVVTTLFVRGVVYNLSETSYTTSARRIVRTFTQTPFGSLFRRFLSLVVYVRAGVRTLRRARVPLMMVKRGYLLSKRGFSYPFYVV